MMDIFKSDTKREKTISISWVVFLGFLTFLLNLYWEPRFIYNSTLNADRSVFAVAGKLINEGKLPYRDFWDHKPPAVFYVDALILRWMGTSLWSFWWANIIWLTLTSVALFLFLRKLTSTLPAILASGVFLVTFMNPDFFGGGNLPETYASLPQVLILVAASFFFSTGRKAWIFLAGLFTGIAFLFKQTCIAPGIGVALMLLLLGMQSRRIRRALICVLWFSLGAILPIGLVVSVWAALGAFGALWDAIVVFNLLYAGSGLSFSSLLTTIQRIFVELPLLPVTLVILGGAVLFARNYRRRRSPSLHGIQGSSMDLMPDPMDSQEITFLAIYLSVPFSIVLVALGGLNILHYYTALVPVFAAASAYPFEQVTHPASPHSTSGRKWIRVLSILAMLALGVVWFSHAYLTEKPRAGLRTSLSKPLAGPLPLSDLARYVLDHTQSDDPILIWGNSIDLYLFTDRPDPSRYLYPQPLFLPSQGPESRFGQFLSDLERHPPAFIFGLDSTASGLPTINVPDDELCPACIPQAVQGMKELKEYVNQHYALVTLYGDTHAYQRVR